MGTAEHDYMHSSLWTTVPLIGRMSNWRARWMETSYCRACQFGTCRTFITRECTEDGRFYGLDIKKERVVLESRHRYANSLKKTVADSKAKGKKHGSTHGLHG